MNLSDVAALRLVNQQIARTKFETVKDLVTWMGAMQAQDYAMAKWAIGVRLPHSTDRIVEEAVNAGEILRTHVLRPTWHFVSADDLCWMLELTAPQIKASMKSRHKELGLDETTFATSHAVIEQALSGGRHLTREELRAVLEQSKIATDNNRLSHLLARAELDGIVCSGVTRAGKHTYALAKERVPRMKPLAKDQALALLAKKYFTSHGSATLQDLTWWSGLSIKDARQALEMVESDFTSETIDSRTYWFSPAVSIRKPDHESVYLLPAYDEFLISYADRSASLPPEYDPRTVSENGLFRPIIVINGQVAGLWKRTITKNTVQVETQLYRRPDKTIRKLIEQAAMEFGHFLGRDVEISHKI